MPAQRLRVRAASHAQITFEPPAPESAELCLENLRRGRLLGRETRPLAVNACAVDIKTHPKATHLRCAVLSSDKAREHVRFSVECGADIEPAGDTSS